MALANKVFFTQTTQPALPRLEPINVTQAIFGATGSIATYEIGTIVALDIATGEWVVWDGSGTTTIANKVDGIVWSPVTTVVGSETIGAVMTQGAFHYDDVLEINVTAFGSEAELRAILQIEELKLRNLRVIGLKGTPE